MCTGTATATREREKAPEGSRESEKKQQVESRRGHGHPHPAAGCSGAPAAPLSPVLQVGKLRHGSMRVPHPDGEGNASLHHGRDDTSSRPPPAPPCSCRNPGAPAPGRQPALPSCLRLLPAPLCPSAPTMACQGDLGVVPRPFVANGAMQGVGRGGFPPPHLLTHWVFVLSQCSEGARGAGSASDAKPAAPGALGGRFPPHTDGCFNSVERLT